MDYRLDGQGLPAPIRPPPEPRGIITQIGGGPLLGESPVPQSLDRQNDQDYQKMQDQLREAQLELAAQRAAAAIPASPQLESIMEKQSQILEAALQVKNRDGTAHRSSGGVIQIHPRASWPKLGDGGPGGRALEELYDKYEEICGIARDGEGMTEKERLMTLKTCLKGSRKRIYENVAKAY